MTQIFRSELETFDWMQEGSASRLDQRLNPPERCVNGIHTNDKIV